MAVMATTALSRGSERASVSLASPTTLPIHRDDQVVIVVETPRESRNKLKFDPELGVYRLERVLPAGMAFPFDFGFIPETTGEDGDPLDAIVLLDGPTFPGCVVLGRLLGVIEVEQQDGGKGPWKRNDRLIAVAGGPKGHASARTLGDVDPFRLKAIGAFFESYHGLDGDNVRVIGHGTPSAAEAAIDKAHKAYEDGRPAPRNE